MHRWIKKIYEDSSLDWTLLTETVKVCGIWSLLLAIFLVVCFKNIFHRVCLVFFCFVFFFCVFFLSFKKFNVNLFW
jgi:hypothetical protein